MLDDYEKYEKEWDFFELYYAIRKRGLDYHDSGFLNMVKAKLEVPGNAPLIVLQGGRPNSIASWKASASQCSVP